MAERKGLSKKLRFEIFKRDGFTCQYCGKRPPEIMLVIDHIHPVKLGGDNDPLNLITSCESCNQGKGAESLDNVPNRPDADLEQLEIYQEISELKKYQQLKQKRDEVYQEFIDQFQELWWDIVDAEWAPSDNRIINWLGKVTPDQIEFAIRRTSTKYGLHSFISKLKYCSAIIRNLRDESAEEEE